MGERPKAVYIAERSNWLGEANRKNKGLKDQKIEREGTKLQPRSYIEVHIRQRI